MAKPNPLVRAWKYASAWFGTKVDEHADPQVQIQQAVQEAQRQHQALSTQAAAVIGNQRQLEMQLDRQLGSIENLQAEARQALVLADKANSDGDSDKAAGFENAAQALANQLVAAEGNVEDLKRLHDQALQAAAQAREAVRNNAMILQQKLQDRTRLLSQLEQAKMQETVSKSLQQMSELAAPSNTPTLDEVRDKIEKRYAVALGQAELAHDSGAAATIEVRRATLDMKGSARLAEIRASLAADQARPAVSTTKGSAGIDAPAAEDAAGETPQAVDTPALKPQPAQDQPPVS
jgi:phage shock protein A